MSTLPSLDSTFRTLLPVGHVRPLAGAPSSLAGALDAAATDEPPAPGAPPRQPDTRDTQDPAARQLLSRLQGYISDIRAHLERVAADFDPTGAHADQIAELREQYERTILGAADKAIANGQTGYSAELSSVVRNARQTLRVGLQSFLTAAADNPNINPARPPTPTPAPAPAPSETKSAATLTFSTGEPLPVGEKTPVVAPPPTAPTPPTPAPQPAESAEARALRERIQGYINDIRAHVDRVAADYDPTGAHAKQIAEAREQYENALLDAVNKSIASGQTAYNADLSAVVRTARLDLRSNLQSFLTAAADNPNVNPAQPSPVPAPPLEIPRGQDPVVVAGEDPVASPTVPAAAEPESAPVPTAPPTVPAEPRFQHRAEQALSQLDRRLDRLISRLGDTQATRKSIAAIRERFVGSIGDLAAPANGKTADVREFNRSLRLARREAGEQLRELVAQAPRRSRSTAATTASVTEVDTASSARARQVYSKVASADVLGTDKLG
ncbi:MAG: hypothetical protein KF745_09300 [Phycisphaeraceae bacterium]|nr:hypothetical protein [Phycisphaeraceae bacterium]